MSGGVCLRVLTASLSASASACKPVQSASKPWGGFRGPRARARAVVHAAGGAPPRRASARVGHGGVRWPQPAVDFSGGRRRVSNSAMDHPARGDLSAGLPSAGVTVTGESTADRAASAGPTEVLVVGVAEEDLGTPAFADLDALCGGILSDLVASGQLKGKGGESLSVRLGKGKPLLVAAGVGKAADAKGRSLGEAAAAACRAAKATSLSVGVLNAGDKPGVDARGLAQGCVLGLYEDRRFNSEGQKEETPLVACDSVRLLLPEGGQGQAEVDRAVDLCAGICQARRLVNGPPNVVDPQFLADQARAIAAANPAQMKCTVLERADCEKLGMGSFLGVAAASNLPPKFIHLVYTGEGTITPEKKLACVGKGLTFDSGGYNIKAGPGSMIELMKFDMGGSAAVLGAARAVSLLKPAGVEVHFIVAACENMISGNEGALRPGDILTASNGKTIEVNNTDAEGRLTLADALVYAERQGVRKIVDLATLTGACIIALGDKCAGLFTPSDSLAAELSEAAKAAGEKHWRMPMEEEYWEQMKSPVADMVNTGSRAGGSITAALFLKRYVDTDKIDWGHIDIAGPVWDGKTKSATGYGVATVVEWIAANSKA